MEIFIHFKKLILKDIWHDILFVVLEYFVWFQYKFSVKFILNKTKTLLVYHKGLPYTTEGWYICIDWMDCTFHAIIVYTFLLLIMYAIFIDLNVSVYYLYSSH
jgi:hypothetical protein